MNTTATVKLVLDPNAADKRLLKILVQFRGVKQRFPSGSNIKLTKAEFKNERLAIRRKATEEAKPLLRKAELIAEELGLQFTFEQFRQRFKNQLYGNDRITLEKLLDAYIKHKQESGVGRELSRKSKEIYHTAVNWVNLYHQNTFVNDITTDFIIQLEKYIRKNSKSSKPDETIKVYKRHIKALMRYALDCGYIKSVPNFGTLKASERVKKAMTESELWAFVKYAPQNRYETLARDFFMLSFYCSGMNLVDLLKLRNQNISVSKDNDGKEVLKLSFIRNKTAKQQRPTEFFLADKAVTILNKYGKINPNLPHVHVLPFYEGVRDEKNEETRRQNLLKSIRKGMNSICDAMGITRYSYENARHTFATFLTYNGNQGLVIISKLLGHSSIEVTRHYIDTLPKSVLYEVKDILDNVTASHE